VNRGEAKRGVVLWATGCLWLTQGFLFVASLGLARMLNPAAFGIVSLAIMGTSLVRRLLIDGVTLSVVAERETERAFLNASFIVAVVIGAAATTALVAVGLMMRSHTGLGGTLPAVFIAFAFMPLLDALGAVQQGLLQRQMRFKEISSWMLLANILIGLISLTIAYRGGGVWSLVVPQLLLSASATALMAVKSRWLPGFATTRARLMGAVRAAGMMASSSFIVFVLGRADILALGVAHGAGATGLYTFGKRIVETFRDLFVSGANGVLLSQTAALQESGSAVSNLLLTYLRMIAAVTFPLFVGLACIADIAVPLVIGDQWRPAIPALRILAFAGPPQMLSAFMVACLMGLADRRSVLTLNLITGAVFTIGLVVLLKAGGVGAAWAYLFQAVVGLGVAVVLIGRRLPIAPLAIVRATIDIVAVNVLMAVLVLALRRYLLDREGAAASLTASIGVGAVVYGLAVGLLLRPLLMQMFGRLGRQPASEPAV
jgi:teichuronic acid exporter